MAAKRSSSFREEKHALDEPPMSRLFVVCGKSHTEEEFMTLFQPFGNVEEVWMVKDKTTGESKGVVYVKFSKTSEAAHALEALNGKVLVNGERPIKVLVASNRSQGAKKASENEYEKCVRLFVLIPRTMTEEELTTEFNQYGELDYVSIIRDRSSRETKGFAYVKYRKFSDAANAFENCDRKYKAMFAEPKPSRNDMITSNDSLLNCSGMNRRMSGSGMIPPLLSESSGGMNRSSQEVSLNVICSSMVNQDQLWRLFDIIPGLDYCHITGEFNRNSNCAIVTYSNASAASYARDKLHGFEYPIGERLIVKGGADLSPIPPLVPPAQNESQGDIQCSVQLPAQAPLASSSATVAQRCFIVCVSQALPVQILRNVFCRFGDLIEVYLLPNKNCGYAKYAREESCRKAIEKLNGAEVYGIRLKVMEAEELSERKRQRRDE